MGVHLPHGQVRLGHHAGGAGRAEEDVRGHGAAGLAGRHHADAVRDLRGERHAGDPAAAERDPAEHDHHQNLHHRQVQDVPVRGRVCGRRRPGCGAVAELREAGREQRQQHNSVVHRHGALVRADVPLLGVQGEGAGRDGDRRGVPQRLGCILPVPGVVPSADPLRTGKPCAIQRAAAEPVEWRQVPRGYQHRHEHDRCGRKRCHGCRGRDSAPGRLQHGPYLRGRLPVLQRELQCAHHPDPQIRIVQPAVAGNDADGADVVSGVHVQVHAQPQVSCAH
mmetsp:Transcript_119660/g.290412  ORF Transcript_119660/g.290412 Transcript_119660/m.290412 type:complete len:279 (+) Transcript_119660:171-1007(+)